MVTSVNPLNPYVIGRPISGDEPKLFFGRSDLFRFIEDNLLQEARVILLHGQRRIGKSSVLSQIPKQVQLEKFVFVPFSLEGESQKSLAVVLHDLAREIINYLDLDDQVNLPSEADLTLGVFLKEVRSAIGGKELVLLLDEFDALGDFSSDSVVTEFFPFIWSLTYQDKDLFVIPVIGRRLDDLPKLLSLFRGAPSQEIGLLRLPDAKALIQDPVEGVLDYEEDAIDAILELSSGHAYFTQLLCFALFIQARENQNRRIVRADVDQIVDRAFEYGESGLSWFWDGIPMAEKIVLLAVAEIQQVKLLQLPKPVHIAEKVIDRVEIVEGEPLTLLGKYGVSLTGSFFKKAEEHLLEWKYLRQTGYGGDASRLSRTYRIVVEFVRRWLLIRYSLKGEIWDLLHSLNPDLDHLYEQAKGFDQIGNKREAIRLYEQVLTQNPNYFKALFRLVPIYKESKDFDKFEATYTRALQVDPDRISSITSNSNDTLQEASKAALKEKIKEEIKKEELAELKEADRKNAQLWQKAKRAGIVAALLTVAGLAAVGLWKTNPTLSTSKLCPSNQRRIGDSQLCGIPSGQFPQFKAVPNVPKQQVRYGGSTSFAPLRSPATETELEKDHPGFDLTYVEPPMGAPGSGSGIRMLLNGQINFAQSSRGLAPGEIAQAKDKGFTLEQVPVAFDSVAFYVNSGVGISSLTIDEIQQILTGKINNWKQVGGVNIEIKIFSRNLRDGGTPEYVESQLLQGQPLAEYTTVQDTTASVRRVANTPGGIGYASAPEVCNQPSVKALAIAKENEFVSACELGQVNMAAIANGSYPLARPLFVIIKRDGGSVDEQAGLAYANLLRSDEGQKMIEQNGFAPVR